MRIVLKSLLVSSTLALMACGDGSKTPDESRMALPMPPQFAACQTCHSVTPGQHGIGPSLAGIANRSAGQVEGYGYSPAFQQADIQWNEETMTKFLLNPGATVPGTKMLFGGLSSPAEAQKVANYVLSLPGN